MAIRRRNYRGDETLIEAPQADQLVPALPRKCLLLCPSIGALLAFPSSQ
ncbi:hypothetical protein FHT92_002189 [Rhizobium sp. BK377]|nr:hypothetical protein [Rhizobium sp. BK377]